MTQEAHFPTPFSFSFVHLFPFLFRCFLLSTRPIFNRSGSRMFILVSVRLPFLPFYHLVAVCRWLRDKMIVALLFDPPTCPSPLSFFALPSWHLSLFFWQLLLFFSLPPFFLLLCICAMSHLPPFFYAFLLSSLTDSQSLNLSPLLSPLVSIPSIMHFFLLALVIYPCIVCLFLFSLVPSSFFSSSFFLPFYRPS